MKESVEQLHRKREIGTEVTLVMLHSMLQPPCPPVPFGNSINRLANTSDAFLDQEF